MPYYLFLTYANSVIGDITDSGSEVVRRPKYMTHNNVLMPGSVPYMTNTNLKIMIKLLTILFICAAMGAHSQHLKVDNSFVRSSYHNGNDLPFLYSDRTTGYAVSVGLDYLEREWFSLSSQLGYMQLGGREVSTLGDDTRPVSDINQKTDYAHINTTVRGFVTYSDIRLFIGVGPYANILIDDQNFESPIFEGPSNNWISVGGKADLGVTCDVDRLRIGVMGTYLRGLSPSVSSEFISLYNRAFLLTATIGYSLK